MTTVVDDLKRNRSLAIDPRRQASVKLPNKQVASFQLPLHVQDRDRAVYNARKVPLISGKEFRNAGRRHELFSGSLGTLRLV